MNVKIAVVATAGTMSGRMIRKKVLKCPHPSMRAASSSSKGRPRMNCTMRNTKNASVPSNLGTIKGKNVFTQPNCWNRMYSVSYTHLRAHETKANLVCRLLLEKKKKKKKKKKNKKKKKKKKKKNKKKKNQK